MLPKAKVISTSDVRQNNMLLVRRIVLGYKNLHLGPPKLLPRFQNSIIPTEKTHNETPNDEDGFEVHHPTMFGSIRLDSKNTPRIKKPPPEDPSFVEEIPRSTPSTPIKLSCPEAYYLEEDVPEPLRSERGKVSLSSNKEEVFGFIDEQYFGSLSSPAPSSLKNEPSIDCSESLRETQELMKASTHDLNPIDEQLFPQHKNPKKINKKIRHTNKNRPDSALDFIKNKMKSISPGEKYEEASLQTKEKLVKEIGLSLQKRLTNVHDHYYEIPQLEDVILEPGAKKHSSVEVPIASNRIDKKYFPRKLHELTEREMADILIKSIIFNEGGIIALNKPYGIPMTSDGSFHHSIQRYLPYLSKHLEIPEDSLKFAHRLDKTTTGVLLLTASKELHIRLTQHFASREMKKVYWAISNGVPSPMEGLIDIPFRIEDIQGRHRSMLVPKIKTPLNSRKRKFTKEPALPAVTEYKIMKSNHNAAFIECIAHTGYKHQIRVHLGFGLNTPILGDHKYSHIRGIGKPQKVNGDILARLKVPASKSRKLPLCLHAREVIIPGEASNEIRIVAGLPLQFLKIKSRLGI